MTGLAAILAGAQGWRRSAAALLLGALATLGLEPVSLTPVLPVAITGLVWLLDGAGTWRKAGWTGWWFGLGYFTTGLYWIANALLVDPGQFAWAIPFAVLGLPAVLGLFVAAATIAAHLVWTPSAFRVLALALAWTGAEWIRGHWFTGFPWNLVGYTWTWSDPVLQITAVSGIYGLSLLTVFAAAAPAALISGPAPRHPATLIERWAPLAISFGLLAAVWSGGALRLGAADAGTVPGVSLRLVQANIPQDLKWEPSQRRENLDRHLRLTQQPSGTAPITHVIWPETAAQFFLDFEPEVANLIGQTLGPNRILITGAPRAEAVLAADGQSETRLWNSVQAMNGVGQVIATYDKSHLVPFGEYIPLRRFLAAMGLEKITPGSLDYSQGPGPKTIRVPGLPAFSPLVCYEAIFPSQVVDRGDRPGWMLNVTNDAWYGYSAGPFQHFAMVRVRAVELGLPLVRAANSGISGVVDAYGRVTAQLGLGQTGVLDAALPVAIAPTLYAKFGDWSLLILFLVCGIYLFYGNFRSSTARDNGK